MPKAIDVRIRGRVPIADDIYRLKEIAEILTAIIDQLGNIGFQGDHSMKIMQVPEAKQTFDCGCGNAIKDGEGLKHCCKSLDHEDWHESEDGTTWPADRPAALPHPDPGGEPLKDFGPGLLETMGLKAQFIYRKVRKNG
jgi:hypothetical protein